MKKPWALSYPLSSQQRLCSNWVDAQADQSLCWSFCLFCHALAQIILAISGSAFTGHIVFGVCNQLRLKPACSATETSLGLEISAIARRGIILSRQRTTKALIRLRRCAGWSAHLLFAYGKTDFLMKWKSVTLRHFVLFVSVTFFKCSRTRGWYYKTAASAQYIGSDEWLSLFKYFKYSIKHSWGLFDVKIMIKMQF